MSKKKPPTVEDINRLNREFWGKKSGEFLQAISKNPGFAKVAADQISRITVRRGISNAPSMEELVEDIASDFSTLKSAAQSAVAKKSRPKRSDTQKSIVMAAMFKARSEGQPLKEFLSSAENQNFDEFHIEIHAGKRSGEAKYIIKCNSLPEKTVAKSTLDGWWSKAN